MKEITAQLNNYRQSPRKVRVVANVLRGKKVAEAKNQLDFLTKRGAGPLHKLLNSAIANAKNLGVNAEALKVKSIEVNAGKILYRRLPAAHGSAHPMRKRTSHIKIVLLETASTSPKVTVDKVEKNKVKNPASAKATAGKAKTKK